MNYYEIAPLKMIRSDSNYFTYCYDDKLALGSFVMISVGSKQYLGLVIKSTTQPSYKTKEISSILTIPTLPIEIIKISLWMSEYYKTHLSIVLQTVLPKGIAKSRRDRKEKVANPVKRERTNYLLNNDQLSATEVLKSTATGTVLLHGVTGSGKTAIYIEYAKYLISHGKSVIMLVPEIALTSQLVAEFNNHFDNILLTHSVQTEAQRHKVWNQARLSDQPVIVIGPRSAIFMPIHNVGAIFIDESHEPSYKQDKSPRYSTLRVASVLADYYNALVVQGSATPPVTEYYLAEYNKRPIIKLAKRAIPNTVSPHVSIIDMKKREYFNKHRFISDELIVAISSALERNEQIIIFHNRRGSASTTLCQNCGWTDLCPECFIPLTLHTDNFILRCHICNFDKRVPTSCPECKSTDIIHKGIGTKLIELEIKKMFMNKKVIRFDGDSDPLTTVDKKYQDLYDGKVDIIIGTQVIAKGLDLPRLSTVGVIQADAGLSLPDYTSSERTFQLIAQVIGRVGRSTMPTSVVIQSYQPTHPSISLAVNQDYQSFYKKILSERQKGKFPPFVYMLKLTCTYKTETASIKNSKQLATKIKAKYPNVSVLGPTPAFYERQHDSYRWQVVVKSKSRKNLLETLEVLPTKYWQFDLDPGSLL